jgi:hypothetical protein
MIEVHINNDLKVQVCSTENTVLITKTSELLSFREVIPVYCENCTDHTDTLCGCNADLWNVPADGAYCKLSAIEGYRTLFITQFVSQ